MIKHKENTNLTSRKELMYSNCKRWRKTNQISSLRHMNNFSNSGQTTKTLLNLIERLRTRAHIRRTIVSRDHNRTNDRIAAILDEAADAIESLMDANLNGTGSGQHGQ